MRYTCATGATSWVIEEGQYQNCNLKTIEPDDDHLAKYDFSFRPSTFLTAEAPLPLTAFLLHAPVRF